MEFHIARSLRNQLQVDGLLFSFTGNVLFADVAACRRFATRLTQLRNAQSDPERVVHAGSLFAMGIIDELSHALIAHYRRQIDPTLHADALRHFSAQLGAENLDRLLLTFVERFPSVVVYQALVTPAEWLAGASDGISHREAALEELILLSLANRNPAFAKFCEIFDDTELRLLTDYAAVSNALPEFLDSRPPLDPEIGSLYRALAAPMLAAPDSVAAQLEFIRERWTPLLDSGPGAGQGLRKLLLAISTVREEEIAIWLQFHPPAPDQHRHAEPGRSNHGFRGDEYIGFDEDWQREFTLGPDGQRIRRYSPDYQAPLHEYEAFSADQAWMPNVVLLAKSTYVWLEQLSQKYLRHIQRLDQIPDEELQLLAQRGINALWLIGLWERSIASRTIKRLRGQADAVASAYSLRDYSIAEDLGGGSAYATLRDRAAHFGIRLASDMVPNHMGIDSQWVIEQPEWFLSLPQSPFPGYTFNGPDISPDSRVEIKIEDHYYDQSDAAVVFRLHHHHEGRTRFVFHGNDGTSFAWNDTAQLDYSRHWVREHVIQTILHVAHMFPIIRFDAAMVLAKRHVQRLWFPLPGTTGSIPSRAENALSQEEFDALMPAEFWREVVDRVAAEVPGTLLLAEAFWLLEGYFVRTLGMHRVYNSAFMHMLRDEENAKYRSYLKKTIEFDPDILKRYVNFMSNPDEKTAIDQFGDGDKCFGVATLLATLPGLPMFAHGQIEGYTERYGMEFKQARMNEQPRPDLIDRHQREIAPLLHRRWLFSEGAHFVLFDFLTDHGAVDENVFAYSNRAGDQRALVLYNNRFGSTRGHILISAAFMDKESGRMRQRVLADALDLPHEHGLIVAWRDHATGLSHLRRATDFHTYGLQLELHAYQRAVLLDWQLLHPTPDAPWDELCDSLAGRGVNHLEEALGRMRMRPLHAALASALARESVHALAQLAIQQMQDPQSDSDLAPALEPLLRSADQLAHLLAQEQTASPGSDATAFDPAAAIPRLAETDPLPNPIPDSRPDSPPDSLSAAPAHPSASERLLPLLLAAARLPALSLQFSSASPLAAFTFLPTPAGQPATPVQTSTATPAQTSAQTPTQAPTLTPAQTQLWAPLLAWLLLHALLHPQLDAHLDAHAEAQLHSEPEPQPWFAARSFDHLYLRPALAEHLRSLGIEATWQIAARIRILLRWQPSNPLDTPALWADFFHDGDVAWLTGLHTHQGVEYVSREGFEAILGWLALPEIVRIAAQPIAAQPSPAQPLAALEANLVRLAQAAEAVGYRLDQLLLRLNPEPESQPAPPAPVKQSS